MPHLSPSHLCRSMSPWVVLAWKLGAIEPSRSRGCSDGVAMKRRKMGDDLARGVRAVVRRIVRAKDADMVNEYFAGVQRRW